MERKPKKFKSSISSTRIFLDDIEEIHSLLERTCEQVQVSDGDYVYDSFKELKKKYMDRKLRSLTLNGDSPHIFLSFDRSISWNHIFKGFSFLETFGDRNAQGAYCLIKEILKERQKWYSYLFLFRLAIALTLLTIVSGMLWIVNPANVPEYLVPLPRVIFSIFFLIIFYSSLSALNSKGFFYTICLYERHKHESFIRRNKDRIIVGVIVASIGALITWIFSISQGK